MLFKHFMKIENVSLSKRYYHFHMPTILPLSYAALCGGDLEDHPSLKVNMLKLIKEHTQLPIYE